MAENFKCEYPEIKHSILCLSKKTGSLILVGSQQHQGASLFGLDVVQGQQLVKFRVFGARIENHSLGSGLNNVIVIIALAGRIQIQGNGVNVFEGNGLGLDFHSRHFACILSYSQNRMSFFHKLGYG